MLTNSGSEKEAYRLLTRLGDANVFYHDPQRRLGLKLTIIGKHGHYICKRPFLSITDKQII